MINVPKKAAVISLFNYPRETSPIFLKLERSEVA